MDFLSATVQKTASMDISIIITLAASLVGGMAVLLAYTLQNRNRTPDAPLRQVIPVLSLLMTVMMQTAGKIEIVTFFGIFGVLSIIRFRSVLTDQRGITFILFAAIMGVLIGIQSYLIAAVSYLMIAVTLFIVDQIGSRDNAVVLSVRLPSDKPEMKDLIISFLKQKGLVIRTVKLTASYLVSTKTNVLSDNIKLHIEARFPDETKYHQFCSDYISFLKEADIEGDFRPAGEN